MPNDKDSAEQLLKDVRDAVAQAAIYYNIF